MDRFLIIVIAAAFLCGCSIGNDYRRPEVDTPKSWHFEEKEAKAAVNIKWWEQFQDPVLNSLIQTALKENKDILIAAARVEEYLGRYRTARGDLFPRASGEAGALRQRITQDNYAPWPEGISPTFSTYQASLSANWEIDLWGKYRRATEAARADLMGIEENRNAVLLSLMAAVANTYIDLRSLDRQLEIARDTLKTREASLELFRLRFAAGVVSELEVSQIKSEYEAARAAIPQIEKSIAQDENAVNLLLGRNPGPVARGKGMEELVPPAVPAGLPSELLSRRPDIRRAEQDLVAANARIGVAKAAYFPSISLTGMLGTSSTDLSGLFATPSRTWNFGGSATVPLFTAGRIAGQVAAAEAMEKQALLQYRQTIQTAFREVEDALAEQNKTREIQSAQAKQVEALLTYKNLAVMRYENGYSNYLEVLDSERNLFNVQLAYTQTRAALFRALVNLYKALGTGWDVAGKD
jgi:multidrug efflux system outer membrane protein